MIIIIIYIITIIIFKVIQTNTLIIISGVKNYLLKNYLFKIIFLKNYFFKLFIYNCVHKESKYVL